MKINADKLKSIARPLSDKEKEAMIYRRENADWLKMSASIALSIRKILRQKNLSQSDFAAMLQVSSAQVSKLLSGKVNFELKTISKIQMVLGEPIINVGSNAETSKAPIRIPASWFVMCMPDSKLGTTLKADAETYFVEYKSLG